jgi:hypothetical protein
MARTKKRKKSSSAPAFAEITLTRAGGPSVTVRASARAGEVATHALRLYTAAAELPAGDEKPPRLGFQA